MKFSYEKIEEYCNEMHQLAQKMKDILEYIDNNTKKIFQNEIWLGPGASYYKEKFSAVSNTFEEVYIEMENSILYLIQVSDGYKNIDNEIINQVNKSLKEKGSSLADSKIFRNS